MQLTIYLLKYFNPRLREGGDHIDEITPGCDLISIHASAREATKGRIRM